MSVILSIPLNAVYPFFVILRDFKWYYKIIIAIYSDIKFKRISAPQK